MGGRRMPMAGGCVLFHDLHGMHRLGVGKDTDSRRGIDHMRVGPLDVNPTLSW